MIRRMNRSDIAQIRLASQHIGGTKFTSPKEVVTWMGAMQAQDYPLSKWAVGVRLPGSTDKDIETAINNADIIRTHLLRPTWHFVSADDIYWLLDLTGPQVISSFGPRDRQLGLTKETFSKSNAIIEKTLGGGKHLTREELKAELKQVSIPTDQNRLSHILGHAEADQIICSGITRNGKHTYALLSERVPRKKRLVKEEALANLAKRYFTSRCPASLQDFTWWSGLPSRDARQALELVKSEFRSEGFDGQMYWCPQDSSIAKSDEQSAFLLPTYDEFIISYTDRTASIPAKLEQYLKVISNRGVFWPIVVVNGQVVGIWKRTNKKDKLIVELELFIKPSELTIHLVEEEANQMGNFLGKRAEVNNKS